MRYSLVVAIVASVTLMTACGSDNSSGVDDSSGVNNTEREEKVERVERVFVGEPVTFSTPGTYTVNKKKQLIVMTKDADKQDVCNFEDGKYSWEPSKKVAVPDTFKYEFFGDTLAFFEVVGGETSEYGIMYVGGQRGELEGTWVNTDCEYTTYRKETECYDSGFKKYALEFSNGEYAQKIDYYFDDYLKDSEKTSFVDNFINQIYEAMVGWYPGISFPGIFYSHGTDENEYTIKRYGIKVLESSDSSQTFTVRKKTYTFKVNQAEQSLGATGEILMEVNVEVTDGKTTCVGDYHLREVGKDQCSAKYEDDYMFDYDFGGHMFKDRTLYLLDNIDEFDKCLMGIAEDLPERDPDYGNLKDSEK